MQTYTYTWHDPNDNTSQSFKGDSYTQISYAPCYTGVAIKVYDAGVEVGFRCYQPGSLVITPNNDGVDPAQKFDCLNGGCIPKSTYNTPGVFANLAACQSGCAKNSNCTGECVSAEELAALQQAASNLRSRLCK
jgi:hypothetical protein